MFKPFGFIAAVVMSMTACGGSSGSESFHCVVGSGTASQTCYGSAELDSAQMAVERSACTQGQGTTVSACPTASLVGCCAVTNTGYSVENCVYQGSAADAMSACAANGGTWSTSP